MKKVTMQDVAERAGVSKSTVSQYINNRYEFMAIPTRLRVEQAIKELDYRPNYVAKSLKQKKTATIGVIVANILHTFSTEIIRSIEDECGKNGFHLFVCNADDQPEKERAYIEMLMAKQVDGLIIFPTNGNYDLYKELKKAEFPIVFVDRKINCSIYPALLLDNESASMIAVEQLMKKKKQKVGVVSTSIEKSVTPRVERIEGYKKALEQRGQLIENKWIIAVERERITEELQKVWESENRPEAFFAINDLALIELLTFIKHNHLKIPEDLSIITIDDSPFLKIAATPVTVIKQPSFEMGKDAATKLLQLIESKNFEETYEVQRYSPILIERESI